MNHQYSLVEQRKMKEVLKQVEKKLGGRASLSRRTSRLAACCSVMKYVTLERCRYRQDFKWPHHEWSNERSLWFNDEQLSRNTAREGVSHFLSNLFWTCCWYSLWRFRNPFRWIGRHGDGWKNPTVVRVAVRGTANSRGCEQGRLRVASQKHSLSSTVGNPWISLITDSGWDIDPSSSGPFISGKGSDEMQAMAKGCLIRNLLKCKLVVI